MTDIPKLREQIERGGAEKYHAANAESGKLFARERIRLLVDEGSFVEDGMFANALAGDLPADGVVTGMARIDGRPLSTRRLGERLDLITPALILKEGVGHDYAIRSDRHDAKRQAIEPAQRIVEPPGRFARQFERGHALGKRAKDRLAF